MAPAEPAKERRLSASYMLIMRGMGGMRGGALEAWGVGGGEDGGGMGCIQGKMGYTTVPGKGPGNKLAWGGGWGIGFFKHL